MITHVPLVDTLEEVALRSRVFETHAARDRAASQKLAGDRLQVQDLLHDRELSAGGCSSTRMRLVQRPTSMASATASSDAVDLMKLVRNSFAQHWRLVSSSRS